jgi:SAM-dependent methyltransferase
MTAAASDIDVTTWTHVGPLRRGRVLRQDFAPRRGQLCGLSLYVGSYRTQVRSTLRLTVEDPASGTTLRVASVATEYFPDNTWQLVPFEPLSVEDGQPLRFSVETDADSDAITLWTNTSVPARGVEGDEALDGAICFRSRYVTTAAYALDAVLFHGAEPPPLPPEREAAVDHILLQSVGIAENYFLRTTHLARAVGATGGVGTILSIGCGEGYQEAFLAGRLPHVEIHATDIAPRWRTFDLDNLSFGVMDILNPSRSAEYDFVFSIECVEHIEDHARAVRNMAEMVAPGGYLYLSVPFANKEEQADERLRRAEWERHEHYTPGFDEEWLTEMVTACGLDVVGFRSMFREPLKGSINALVRKLSAGQLMACLPELCRLFLLDTQSSPATSRREATGINVLARKSPRRDSTRRARSRRQKG